uniref:Interleukin family protein n=1 Tax=Oreochromis niloticus TaxID=8128 RepID=A0A669E3B3_ORENI
MTSQTVLLCVLALASFFSSALCSPMCNNHCCRFVEGFPVRLKKLRQDYSRIRDFYEANDDLDSALLDQSVEDSFKSPFACYAMNSLLEFYLDTVLPTAMAGVTEEIKDLKPHVESIQEIFNTLKRDVTQCVKCACLYFSPFVLNEPVFAHLQMESRGLYKAMGELDILFNYFETYLASKRHRQ